MQDKLSLIEEQRLSYWRSGSGLCDGIYGVGFKRLGCGSQYGNRWGGLLQCPVDSGRV